MIIWAVMYLAIAFLSFGAIGERRDAFDDGGVGTLVWVAVLAAVWPLTFLVALGRDS